MMEVLELKPLKKKNLNLIILESEFPIEWYFEDTSINKENLILDLNLVSKEYLSLLEHYIHHYQPNFGIEEKGIYKNFISDPVKTLFENNKIPYEMIDISENATDYLRTTLEEYISYSNTLEDSINEIIIKNHGVPPKNSIKFEQLIIWREYLKREYKNGEDEIRCKVREAWMMMRIINIAKKFKKDRLKALFICDSSHFKGIYELSEKLNIKTEQIRIKKKVNLNNGILTMNRKGNIQLLEDEIMDPEKSLIELSGIKIKEKDRSDKICYFFDTDDNASPFDINMAYDAGFDVVIPFSKMTADKVSKLAQDAIFSRKPNAPTIFFIGGSNIKEAELIAKNVLDSLVPPFEYPVIIDPRGSHTTASAVVAKTLSVIKSIKNKKVVILGTGPVAIITAMLAAQLKANIYLVETWDKININSIDRLIYDLNDKIDKDIENIIFGINAYNIEDRFEIVKNADIIWSLAGAGVEILPSEIMQKLSDRKLVIDINLVPPYGIEGLKPNHDNKEIYPDIYGIGALVIGKIKSKIEALILKEAANTKGKKVFDYKCAFKTAMSLLKI